MKSLAICVAAIMISLTAAARAMAQPDPTPDQLIDRLTQVSCNGPGLYNHFPYPDFWAVVPDRDAKARLEGPQPDCMPAAMRSLVRLGPAALPALVRHIDDARPTGLKIGDERDSTKVSFGGQVFTAEYDSRAHVYDPEGWPSSFRDPGHHPTGFTDRAFYRPYTVRVGDVCFSLIGQIVNRHMIAARYQPTFWIMVNSPIETPSLAAKVCSDWAEADADGLRAALLADLHTPLLKAPAGYRPRKNDPLTYEQAEESALEELRAGALRRLRFYYPETYAALSGDDLAKRHAFEKEEVEATADYEH